MFTPSRGERLMFSQCKPIPCCSYLMTMVMVMLMLTLVTLMKMITGGSWMVSHTVSL